MVQEPWMPSGPYMSLYGLLSLLSGLIWVIAILLTRCYTGPMTTTEEDHYDEGTFCPSCDGSISPDAITCPCGVMLKEMADPCEGMSFEERMAFEVVLENEERAMCGAPLIPMSNLEIR